MHGAFLAYDVQIEIVSVPLESVAHEVEGPRGEYGGYGRLQVGLVYLVPRLYVKFAHQVVGFILCDPLESDARKHYGYLPDVDGGRALELRDIRTEPALQFLELLFLRRSGIISALDDDRHALGIETHHVEFVQVGLDGDVRYADILLEGVPSQDIDCLPDEVGNVVDVLVCHVPVGKLDADDDVRPHLLGYVGRVVVAHSSVYEYLVAGLDGREYSRDRHRGPERSVEFTLVP